MAIQYAGATAKQSDRQSKWYHAYANDATKFRRRTDYTYNRPAVRIRSWLTSSNTKYQETQGTDLPFYSIGLDYANGGSYTNGNISAMKWDGKDVATITKGLSFNYDGANRLSDSFGLGGYADTENEIKYESCATPETEISSHLYGQVRPLITLAILIAAIGLQTSTMLLPIISGLKAG